MKILNQLKAVDFVDRRKNAVLLTEANFHILLAKHNEVIDAHNQLAIKVFDLEQALQGKGK